MTDDETSETPDSASAAGTEPATSAGAEPATASAGADGGGRTRSVRGYVQYALLAGLLLLGFIALVQFYLSASSAISTWINQEYRQLFRAVFNLVVLLLVAAAVSRLLRRIDR